MGYCIEMTDYRFIIRKENFDKSLESLKSVFIPENMTTYDYINGEKRPHFRWVHTESVLECKTLQDALCQIRYETSLNENGDICDLIFTGEKYGDEEIFFKALAPYVEPGCYISFKGEDGDEWCWDFDELKNA